MSPIAEAAVVKRCARCEETKPVDEFTRRSASRDGLQSYCKDCARELGRESSERRRDKIRQWERDHMTPCVDCGTPVHGWRGKKGGKKGSKRCTDCSKVELRERYRAQHAAAYRQIEEWWAEGLTIREIAERGGRSERATRVLICRLRDRGYSLPYRRPRQNPTHPEQVPS